MADFLERLADRALGLLPPVEYLRPSRFAPLPVLGDDSAQGLPAVGVELAAERKAPDWDDWQPLVPPQSIFEDQIPSPTTRASQQALYLPLNAGTGLSAAGEFRSAGKLSAEDGSAAAATPPEAAERAAPTAEGQQRLGRLTSRAGERSEKHRSGQSQFRVADQQPSPEKMLPSEAFRFSSIAPGPRRVAVHTPLRPLLRPLERIPEETAAEKTSQVTSLGRRAPLEGAGHEAAVRIRIGRIEVRAVLPAEKTERRPPAPPAPGLTLEDYLRRRNHGER